MKCLMTTLAIVSLVACVTADNNTYEHGSLNIHEGAINVSCQNGRAHFSGLSIHSDDAPITRFVLQAGIDANGNGELDPDEITREIDNPSATNHVSVTQFEIGVAQEGQSALIHFEVYQGGERPVYSNTYGPER